MSGGFCGVVRMVSRWTLPSTKCLPDTVTRAGRSEVTDAHLSYPWFRINRVLRVMLQTPWHATQQAAWGALKKGEWH